MKYFAAEVDGKEIVLGAAMTEDEFLGKWCTSHSCNCLDCGREKQDDLAALLAQVRAEERQACAEEVRRYAETVAAYGEWAVLAERLRGLE